MPTNKKEKEKTMKEKLKELDKKINRYEKKYETAIHTGCLKEVPKKNYTNLLRERLDHGLIYKKEHAKFLLQIGLTEQESLEGDETSLKLLKGKKLNNEFVSMHRLYCEECGFMPSEYAKHTEEICNSEIANDDATFDELIKKYKTAEQHEELPPESNPRYYVYCLMDNAINDAENIRLSDVRSIFYIGYRIKTRPSQHFEADCLKKQTTQPQKGKTMKKNMRIRQVWDNENPVVIYKMGPLTLLDAIRMEAVLINVLQKRLTNDRIPRLSDFGISWSKEDRVDYALYLLHELFKTVPTHKSPPWLDETAKKSKKKTTKTKNNNIKK